jgi:uncharacterized protein YecE (DUF72 family)
VSGTLYVGTSGFSYPDWAPVFYPPGSRAGALLPLYATRLPACELNNTYYRQPTPERIRAWVAATPPGFRFTVKAQRGGSLRALLSDPAGTLPWLVGPLAGFGDRLGSVLFRVPGEIERDVGRLRALLDGWPAGVPATFEFQDPSWVDDDVFDLLRAASAAVCATELETDLEPPRIDLTGRFLYLRLRREAYTTSELEAWATRIVPFLEAGSDVFAFFRHDADGASALRALELRALVERAVR